MPHPEPEVWPCEHIASVDPRRRGRCVKCDRLIPHYLQPEPKPETEPENPLLMDFHVGETVTVRFKGYATHRNQLTGRVTMESPTMVALLGPAGNVVVRKSRIGSRSRHPRNTLETPG